MRFRLALFSLLTLFLATSLVHAQMSRGGGMGVARGGSRTPGIAASAGRVVPRGHVSGTQAHFHRSDARQRTAGAVSSPSFRHAPSSGFGRRPFHDPHHPHHLHHRFFLSRHPHFHHFHRHPGIVIIEVPRFFGSTVVTQLVPDTRWMGQPMAISPLTDSRARFPGQLAPFDPTPQEVVERMLALVATTKGDVVYDLGAGDGRVVLTAAQKYGAQAVGFEIDPGLVKLARENVRKAGMEKLVEIRQQDFLTADLSPATVVTLYLSRDGNEAVKPLLLRQLKSGARVVSYTFDMGDWTPKITEAYRDAAGGTHMLYYWEIAAPLASRDH